MKRNELSLIVVLIALVTIGFGFIVWWTLPLVAFISALYLARSHTTRHALILSSLSPALGWVCAALGRDLFEGGRVSAKLAGLFHLGYGVFVYVALFALAAIVSFFGALSGSEVSKSFR